MDGGVDEHLSVVLGAGHEGEGGGVAATSANRQESFDRRVTVAEAVDELWNPFFLGFGDAKVEKLRILLDESIVDVSVVVCVDGRR